jgi:hypothetical protein
LAARIHHGLGGAGGTGTVIFIAIVILPDTTRLNRFGLA